jgi:hypothetical protein
MVGFLDSDSGHGVTPKHEHSLTEKKRRFLSIFAKLFPKTQILCLSLADLS